MTNEKLKEYAADLRQVAFKLQTDLDQKDWEYACRNLPFLKEIKDKLVKGEADITQREFAYKMIDDWINEMEEFLNQN